MWAKRRAISGKRSVQGENATPPFPSLKAELPLDLRQPYTRIARVVVVKAAGTRRGWAGVRNRGA